MIKTTEFAGGVNALTELARKLNPEIGSYLEHFYIENFGFIVRLNNGGIKIPRELAMDCEKQPASVSSNNVNAIAESFWRN